ncbi:MAG: hypothetical protein LBK22_08660 [Tannerella sp.]|jgi:hypothetical protein|nr:hypothetical protein [Tannerella sp.]
MTGGSGDGDMPEGLTVMPGECLPDVEDRYVYPAIPGTEAWNSASEEEKEKLCQLPEERIKTGSSYALICGLLDSPRLWDCLLSSHSSPVVTCDRAIFSKHNSVPEFEKRKDRVQALITYYAAVGRDCYESLDVNAQMNFSIQLHVLEVWFIRDAILHSMDAAQKKQAVALLLQKHERKQSYSDASLIAMAWIMYDSQYAPVRAYYRDGTLHKESSVANRKDDIISFAKNCSQLN